MEMKMRTLKISKIESNNKTKEDLDKEVMLKKEINDNKNENEKDIENQYENEEENKYEYEDEYENDYDYEYEDVNNDEAVFYNNSHKFNFKNENKKKSSEIILTDIVKMENKIIVYKEKLYIYISKKIMAIIKLLLIMK